jgi:serine/threonine-protein kinase
MDEQHEAELRIAVAEGLLAREELDDLRQKAWALERSPLAVLVEQGRLSEESLAPLRRALREALRLQAVEAEGAATLPPSPETPDPARESDPAREPAFPVPGWERYEPLRFLGQGGMGQVFLARDPRLRREVALKFVRGDDAALTRRFLSEARAQARVEHERVCQVYEVGEVQGRPFIAMQYVEGQPLHQLARELTLEQKLLVLRDAAEGVHAAHRAGLIHRDLKPSNILVERTEDGRLEPYVMDFGLARDWREQSTTATGDVLGTPHYMAPEQARGEVEALDRRCDVYSLGATLYHLLTGEPPIPGANGLEVLSLISTHEPRPPRALAPHLPVDVEAIVLKCLEKERSARYDSARALAEDLERFLSGEPVRARSTGPGYWLRKKVRKHRRMVAVAGVALLAVGLALGQTALTRREAVRRERLVQRFTEQVGLIDALARYSGLARLHDTRPDREAIRERMRDIEAVLREGGELAAGPGHYALGRGELALGNEARAREHLEAAWGEGYREPRVAYALALVYGHLYQETVLEAERLRTPELREARKRDLERQYRDPALAYLRQSGGADVPSPEYVAALLALHESRFDDALGQLDALGERRSWLYEVPQLRGDILRARASQRWNKGDEAGARADVEAGRRAYAAAAALGESVPEVHLALAKLETQELVFELYGRGEVLPPFTRGQAAVARALQALPDNAAALVQEARLYNRLAEYRMGRGGDVEEAVQKASAAARRALALEHSRRARMELGQSLWRQARARQGHGMDPTEPLRQALETFEQVESRERDYEFHATLGLVHKIWADHEDQKGTDSRAHRSRAIESYREAIRLDARVPDAWINLGLAYLTRATHPKASAPEAEADLEQARLALETCRELSPQNYVPYFLGGQLHAELAQRRRDRGGDARVDLATALELYQRGSAINPRIAQFHNGAALVLIEQAREAWDRDEPPFARLEEARAACTRAIEVAPQQGFGHNNLGEVHYERATYRHLAGEDPRADLQEAEAAYRKAAELLPGLAEPWANLARAHATLAAFELERGRDPRRGLERAEQALRGTFERNAQQPQAWLTQGEVRGLRARWLARQHQARAGDFEEAARAFDKALELQPRRLDFRVAYGQFCREWARWSQEAGLDSGPALERGLARVDEVLAARPSWTTALRLRASLRQEMGRPVSAAPP